MAARRPQEKRKGRPAELGELRTEMRAGFKEMRDGFTAVRAEMRDGIEDLRAETHEGFKGFGLRLAALDEKMDAGFARIDGEFQVVKSDLEVVKHDLTLVKQDVGLLQTAVIEHGKQLKEIREKKVDRDEVEAIVERVVARAAGH